MKYLSMLRLLISVTLIVVRYGLRQGPSFTVNISEHNNSYSENIKTIKVDELKLFIAALDAYVDEHSVLSIEIPGCPGFVAPVLLFLLKRRGFSRCKAWIEPSGLALSAIR